MKKVIMVGFYAPDNIRKRMESELVPGVEVWTVNDWYRVIPWLKPDRVFQIHPAAEVEEMSKVIGRYPDYKKEYVSYKDTLYVTADHFPFIPNNQQRTFDQTLFDKYGKDLFSSTMIYMLVEALEERYDEISMYGICLMGSDEYAAQLPQTRYLMEVMRNKGIKIFNEFEENWFRCYPETNNIKKLPKIDDPYIFVGKYKRETEWGR